MLVEVKDNKDPPRFVKPCIIPISENTIKKIDLIKKIIITKNINDYIG